MNPTLRAVIIELTEGNIANHHIYLRGADGLFPDDAFGGRNSMEAGRPIEIVFSGDRIDTDIDKTKSIFRERGAVRRFFQREKLVAGDVVLIRRVGNRAFEVTKADNSSW
ncbi:hypothetical protein [Notoacmeibacter marinus]|uniref:hypothetical protein n=1 Tax=Notoacmeibacter marinus TaxID=1876515 RepID=UPI000DF3D589|nr:hypothetical protein [Notoacmeibacter marinus]